MLYYLKNTKFTEYRTCGHSHYKHMTRRGRTFVAYRKLRYFSITPRMRRLFMSPKTVEHMTWHQSHDVMDGVMTLLMKKRKHFNSVHPQFSMETRNVLLGLWTFFFLQARILRREPSPMDVFCWNACMKWWPPKRGASVRW